MLLLIVDSLDMLLETFAQPVVTMSFRGSIVGGHRRKPTPASSMLCRNFSRQTRNLLQCPATVYHIVVNNTVSQFTAAFIAEAHSHELETFPVHALIVKDTSTITSTTTIA